MDVLASRAPDDRRAMEVALIKALTSPNTEEEGRRRARQALEEYGFVARQSATLLAAHDICERASAARTLGEIGAASSLPFLLEALYDNEPIVRNQCVSSLGILKLPSAIGALLDVARRHPSIPDSLLSHALSACSVESFGIIDVPPVPALLTGQDPLFTGEITALESTGMVDDLPDFVEDAELIEALGQLESPEMSLRAAAVRQLAQFPVQRSVQALASVAIQDPEPAVRGSAVSCLGSIDHESVFAPVLIALADESDPHVDSDGRSRRPPTTSRDRHRAVRRAATPPSCRAPQQWPASRDSTQAAARRRCTPSAAMTTGAWNRRPSRVVSVTRSASSRACTTSAPEISSAPAADARETRRASNSTRRIISAAGLSAAMTVDSPAGPSRWRREMRCVAMRGSSPVEVRKAAEDPEG